MEQINNPQQKKDARCHGKNMEQLTSTPSNENKTQTPTLSKSEKPSNHRYQMGTGKTTERDLQSKTGTHRLSRMNSELKSQCAHWIEKLCICTACAAQKNWTSCTVDANPAPQQSENISTTLLTRLPRNPRRQEQYLGKSPAPMDRYTEPTTQIAHGTHTNRK